MTQARLLRRLGWVLVMFAAVYGLELFSWGLIGNAARNNNRPTQ